MTCSPLTCRQILLTKKSPLELSSERKVRAIRAAFSRRQSAALRLGGSWSGTGSCDPDAAHAFRPCAKNCPPGDFRGYSHHLDDQKTTIPELRFAAVVRPTKEWEKFTEFIYVHLMVCGLGCPDKCP
jgi:hypothetical protein